MKTKQKLNISIVSIINIILIFLLLLLIFIPLRGQAATDKYINVDSGNPWYFAKTDSGQIVASHPDGQIALFIVDGPNKWKQAPGYYYPGATATCINGEDLDVTYIEFTPSDLSGSSAYTPYGSLAGNDTEVIPEKYTLIEPAICNGGTEAKTEITLGEVGEELSQRLANINNGREPLGCQGFGNIPAGPPAVDKNYWCPEKKGIVLKGEYIADPTPEQIAELEAEISKKALTNVSKCSKEENKEDPECTGENPQPTCEDSAGNWGFIICFIAEITGDITNTLENNLYSLLRTPELTYGGEIYQQWGVIRSIATSLLILIGLIAIASQVFNLQFISTYTMKKIIPKLIIATILIFLSYYLLSLLVTLSNAVGDGVGSLIMGPFDSGQLLESSKSGDALKHIISKVSITGEATGVGVTSTIVVATIAFIANGGIGVAIMGLFVAFFAVLMGFFTLVLRKVMIIGLVMIAPLAIVAWILPGTEKWFKQWWSLLSKLLIMFPLVIGLISFGRVGAYLIANTGVISNASQPSSSGTWQMANILNIFAIEQNGATGATLLIMVIVAYFAPYFFIPAMFKTAGGAFAKISGGLQNKGKSLGNKSGKWANNSIGNGIGRLQSRKNNKFTRGLNRAYRGAILPNRFGGRGLNAKSIAESDKALREQDQQVDTLTRASVAGLDRDEQERILTDQAKGSDKVAARSAIRTMKAMGMNSELRKVFYESDSAKKSIIELQSTDDSIAEYMQTKLRDMSTNSGWKLDGTVNLDQWEKNMGNMTAPEIEAMHKSGFTQISNGHGSYGVSIDGFRITENNDGSKTKNQEQKVFGSGRNGVMDDAIDESNRQAGPLREAVNNIDAMQYSRMHQFQQNFVSDHSDTGSYRANSYGAGTPTGGSGSGSTGSSGGAIPPGGGRPTGTPTGGGNAPPTQIRQQQRNTEATLRNNLARSEGNLQAATELHQEARRSGSAEDLRIASEDLQDAMRDRDYHNEQLENFINQSRN